MAERLAINLFDLDRLVDIIRQSLFNHGRNLILKPIVIDKDRRDETAVEFSCDLLQAATICDIIRSEDRKLKQYPTRVYYCRETAWTKVSSDAVLTLQWFEEDGDRLALNPNVFKVEVELVESVAPERRRVDW